VLTFSATLDSSAGVSSGLPSFAGVASWVICSACAASGLASEDSAVLTFSASGVAYADSAELSAVSVSS